MRVYGLVLVCVLAITALAHGQTNGLLLLGAGPSGAAAAAGGITLIANGAKSLGQNGGTTDAINSTGANFCTLAVATDAGVTLASGDISDTTTATWTLSGGTTYGFTTRIHVFYANLTGTASHTFTVTKNSSFASAAAICFSGVNATPFDDEDGGSGSTTIEPAGALTPSVNNSLVVTALAINDSATITTPTGYDETNEIAFGSTYGVVFAYDVQGTAAATQPQWGASAGNGHQTQAVVFKPS